MWRYLVPVIAGGAVGLFLLWRRIVKSRKVAEADCFQTKEAVCQAAREAEQRWEHNTQAERNSRL